MKESDYIEYVTHMLDDAMHNSQQISESYVSILRDYVAKRDKQNEWLTDYHDAEKLIMPFSNHLRGKKVYCNCDNPESSGTFQFLLNKFHEFGLETLVSTGFNAKRKLL